jgi:2,2-dialkylglycine decarboxylase (pyruvate)
MRSGDEAAREGTCQSADSPSMDELSDPRVSLIIPYVAHLSPVVVASSAGSWLTTKSGKSILDLSSGQICSTLGHRHPRVVKALQDALETMVHLDSTMLSEPVLELAEKLLATLPDPLDRCMFLSTGAEAIEVALKLAKMSTERFEAVGVARSFHGVTSGSISYTFLPTRRGYGPLLPGSHAVPAPYALRCPIRHCAGQCDMACLEAGFEHVQQCWVNSPAAFIVEPVQSSGGVIVPPDGYLRQIRELCDRYGMLFIVDESQTGLGRLGTTYGFEHDGVVPDVVVLSKTLGGGIPLSAVVTSSDIASQCGSRGFSHLTSHVSDPLPAAAGIAVLDIVQSEKLAERARVMGDYFLAKLNRLKETYACIAETRGRGLLLGVEFWANDLSREPALGMARRVADRCLSLGVSVHAIPTGRDAYCLRIAPPLTVTTEEIDFAVDVLSRSISEVDG